MEMKPRSRIWALLILLAATGLLMAGPSGQFVYDLRQGRRLELSELAPELRKSRIVVIGEQHTDEGHHRAQLKVIQAMVQAGAKIAVGLEMFRKDSQHALDRWTAGDIGPREFEAVYDDNWNYPWAAYSAIFEYARAQRIPMIGLNVPRELTRQVSRGGFQSLTEAQRGQLSEVTCSIDEDYLRYIRRVYGAHAHGNMNFTFFCEAQMIWDVAMAVHSLDYLKANPDDTLVILTGVGHAQKGGVPRQIRLRSQVPIAVMLPEVPGSTDSKTVDVQDADYILLDAR
ncbi:MAG: ChaN family lipoprotein [Deltaproteobacteria bacterium]|nr:ChaN family lipoprotein [Deltaproteobacteria bacterium]